MLSKDFCSLLRMENTSKSKKQAERGVFPVDGIMAQMPYKNMWVPSAASVPSIQDMGDCELARTVMPPRVLTLLRPLGEGWCGQ